MYLFKLQNAIDVLQQIQKKHQHAAFANSFSLEDMVLTDMISSHAPNIENFTLDTGRLHEETYGLIAQVKARYRTPIKIYFPDSNDLEPLLNQQGPNGFYENRDWRKACCHVRKVLPLKRALQGKSAWLTGLRQDQNVTRAQLRIMAWDEQNAMDKYSPLFNWSSEDVWEYLRQYEVPYNILHDKGFSSIGCAPCTRAVKLGEDPRAGRWWWENAEQKECGLHVA